MPYGRLKVIDGLQVVGGKHLSCEHARGSRPAGELGVAMAIAGGTPIAAVESFDQAVARWGAALSHGRRPALRSGGDSFVF